MSCGWAKSLINFRQSHKASGLKAHGKRFLVCMGRVDSTPMCTIKAFDIDTAWNRNDWNCDQMKSNSSEKPLIKICIADARTVPYFVTLWTIRRIILVVAQSPSGFRFSLLSNHFMKMEMKKNEKTGTKIHNTKPKSKWNLSSFVNKMKSIHHLFGAFLVFVVSHLGRSVAEGRLIK